MNLDRFAYGLPDPQDGPYVAEVRHCTCCRMLMSAGEVLRNDYLCDECRQNLDDIDFGE